MPYSTLPGYPFTGQDPERDEKENLVGITRGERQKAQEEEPWIEDEIDAMRRENCLAVPAGNDRVCGKPAGHSGPHSWEP